MLKTVTMFAILFASLGAHAEDKEIYRLTCTFVCNQSAVCDVKQLDPTGALTNGRAPNLPFRKSLRADDANPRELKADIGTFSVYASAVRADYSNPRLKILNRTTLTSAESPLVTVSSTFGGNPDSEVGSVTLGAKASTDVELSDSESANLHCNYRKQK